MAASLESLPGRGAGARRPASGSLHPRRRHQSDPRSGDHPSGRHLLPLRLQSVRGEARPDVLLAGPAEVDAVRERLRRRSGVGPPGGAGRAGDLGPGHLVLRGPVSSVLLGLDVRQEPVGHRLDHEPHPRSQESRLPMGGRRQGRRFHARGRLERHRSEPGAGRAGMPGWSGAASGAGSRCAGSIRERASCPWRTRRCTRWPAGAP